ncbi:hypothetical protein PO124_29765 [Bacillus licheniformis]|nr:hypothetical protein [Bacillus licheniformis]
MNRAEDDRHEYGQTRYQLFTVLRDYGYILFGSAVVAVTFNMFCFPTGLQPAESAASAPFAIVRL